MVQGLIARYILTQQLRQMGVLGQGDEIPASSQFELVIKILLVVLLSFQFGEIVLLI